MTSIFRIQLFPRVGLATTVLASMVALALSSGLAQAAPPSCPTAPVITDVTPSFGPVAGGTSVTITGTGFCSDHLGVSFGANAGTSVTFNDSTSITVTTPASAITGPVAVTVRQRSNPHVNKTFTLADGFTYTCDGCVVSPVSIQYEGVDTVQQQTEANGVLEPGETAVQVVTTVLNSDTVTENNVTGAITSFTGPQNGASDIVYTADDSAATYGTILSGATADCAGDSYELTVTIGGSGNRPTIVNASDVDWDATMTEQPAVNASTTGINTIPWRIHVGKTFTDVPTTFLLYDYVERLVHNKVTFGLGGGLFGPNGTPSRVQLAAFLSRSFAGGDANVPSSGTISPVDNPVVNGSYDCTVGGTSLYADIAPGNGFCRYIHYITNLNVTNGCDTTPDFCPAGAVSRRTMAIFVSRTLVAPLGDDGVPDANTGTGAFSGRTYDCTNGPAPFFDVALGGSCKNIGYLWTLGIVDGNGGNFGPSTNVTRAQMAKFLDNAFNLSIGPAQ